MTQATLEKSPFNNSNLFSAYYLSERLRDRSEWDCDEDAREAFDDLAELYELEQDLLPSYKEDALIDSWIDEVLDILGYGTNVETTLPEGDGYVDVLLFEDTKSRRDAAEVYLSTNDTTDLFEGGISLLEAKQWDADFSKRFSENRPYYNASQQIRRYLDKTPANIEWGILTNGRKWRLYGTKDHEAQIYYEVDLPELIEEGNLNRFKYFYLFFRPDAFRKVSGSTFLDSVWSESETATQELGDDLQDNVFRALRVLGHGIVETNDLDIDPDDDEALSELKEQSLVLLYRLMFVLYAESRQLIDPEGKQAKKEYEQNFSLNQHRLEIHDTIGEIDTGFEDEYSTFSTSIWNHLQDLFRLVDQGKESLGIPPYNGGLFDHDEHAFLTEHQVSDRHLAEVIYRLSTTENDKGRYVLADYGDLDTRHLGSVYEGLLEHQFRIAPEDYVAVAEDGSQVWKPATEVMIADPVETVEKGSLYVTNDEGERKATGAYYTPDYVVNYIVEETVGPLVDDIREDLVEQGFETGTQEYLGAFLRRVTQLKILDPAMGSGHFLTGATGYLAEQVMKEVREVEVEMGVAFNEQHVRREIAKECIYGVDINGMAVELAKLSMWLETLAADRPLAFLDHHLKTGNSLVGSDITEVLSEDNEETGGQLTLTQSFARARQQTLEHVMELMSDLLAIDNERLEDIKSMEELYDEIRDDPLYQRLFEIANVHTAEQFGVDVPDDVYEMMAGAVDDAEAWVEIQREDWFKSAQALAGEQSVFHWELEYPEVFFGDDGGKLTDAGFDVVIGNPPYVQSYLVPNNQKEYLEHKYESTVGRWDLYLPFTEIGYRITHNSLSYIQPTMFFRRDYGKGLRNVISENSASIDHIVDFSDMQVFESATNYVGIFTLDFNSNSEDEFQVIIPTSEKEFQSQEEIQSYPLRNSDLSDDPWKVIPADVARIIEAVPDSFVTLEEVTSFISKGIDTSADSVFYLTKKEANEYGIEQAMLRPLLKGEDIHRYEPPSTQRLVLFPYKQGNALSENELESNYPNTWEYLQENRDQLESRTYLVDSGYSWFEFWRKREEKLYSNDKILSPEIAKKNEFTIDRGEVNHYFNTKVRSIKTSDESDLNLIGLLGILNSSVVEHMYKGISPPKRGGYRSYLTGFLNDLLVPEECPDKLENHVETMLSANESLSNLNLSILDHFGSYSDGQSLSEIGLTQPPRGSAESILQETATEKPNLRVGSVSVSRESKTTVEIQLTARYKPSEDDDLDESEFETDQWGYTETDLQPALRITDLTETEADLIEAFVPVAIDEASGFAGFRETATKTNSLVDRLRKLTLPALSDVEAGLESYIQTKDRAEELEERIERTDKLIDEIVYELYGLTDEEIEIVEEAVNG